ncbi:predicted protein [Plenodomus lingam JN3]|uniref:Predicted protein n=1 Tax=Leptosphaeria maculans (strain JN3 / isolate v23.1.3 / race Av1-4-5-6-7-8) TaxID=985895 RepID=E5AA14_LEPMJ|nr:predicted protein [Plenodomus lingam JN3]CBY00505.1 predicted protein [Plenodomus lingam JN3]
MVMDTVSIASTTSKRKACKSLRRAQWDCEQKAEDGGKRRQVKTELSCQLS